MTHEDALAIIKVLSTIENHLGAMFWILTSLTAIHLGSLRK